MYLTTIVAAAGVAALSFMSTSTDKHAELTKGAAAPAFTLRSAKGGDVRLSDYAGKRVLLVFERFVGCPICNLHVHELIMAADSLKKVGIETVVVYQTEPAELRRFAETEQLPITLLGDPKGEIYAKYNVPSSMMKMMGGVLFHGDMKKAKEGGKLYKGKYGTSMSGRLGAEFVLDADGIVEQALYKSHAGEHIDLKALALH